MLPKDLNRVALLPLTVRFREDERATSILNRLAVRRGSPTVLEFLKTVPHCHSIVARSARAGERLEIVATMTGFPLAAIEHSTPVRTPEGWFLNGLSLTRGHLLRMGKFTRAHICPQCLIEDRENLDGAVECRPYRRFWWDLDGFVGCPNHGTPMISACPACNANLGSNNLRPDICCCGLDLTKEKQPKSIDGFDRELLAITRGGPRPPWAEGLSIRAVAGLAFRVGALASIGCARQVKSRINGADQMEMSATGAEILGQGKYALFELFDRTIANGNRETPSRGYGTLYTWLIENAHSELDRFRNLLTEHAGDDIYGTSYRLFGTIIPPYSPNEQHFVSSVSGRDEFCSLLGINKNSLLYLKAKHNKFNFQAIKNKKCGHYLYDIKSIRELMIRSQDLPVYASTPDHLVPVKAASSISRSWVQVFNLVLKGDIAPIARLVGQDGLASLLVEKSAVMEQLPIKWPNAKRFASNPGANPPATIPVHEITLRMGLSSVTVAELRRRSIILYRDTLSHNGAVFQSPCANSVRQFEQRYVTFRELLETTGLDRFALSKVIAEAGLTPLLANSRRSDSLFDRQQATASLLTDCTMKRVSVFDSKAVIASA